MNLERQPFRRDEADEMMILPFHFMRFYRDLRNQAATLQYLSEQTWTAGQEIAHATRSIPRPVERVDGTAAYAPDTKLWQVQSYTNDIDRLTLTSNILGGAAIMILDDLTQSLAVRLRLPSDKRKTSLNAGMPTGPALNDVPVAALLNAAANNFRHYNEWARIPWPHTPEIRKKFATPFKSIDVLAKALRITDGPIRIMMTGRVLNQMSFGSYGLVENKMRQIPEDLAMNNRVLEGARRVGLQILANLDNAAKPPSHADG